METGFPIRHLKSTPLEEAEGLHALHDMTRIVPGKEKGPAFKNGHLITGGDMCRLQKMGRQYIYVHEANGDDADWVHEDEAALSFAKSMAGPGTAFSEAAREGKAELTAATDGMFIVDSNRLQAFNNIPGVVCASRHGFSVVKKGDKLAGTRALPIYLHQSAYAQAMGILEDAPLFNVTEMKKVNVGILVTGTEVFQGLIKDKFAPIITKKVEKYGCRVAGVRIVPDDQKAIKEAVELLLEAGADLIVTTAGLSVDPDDVTRQGLEDAGAADLIYGAAILPGNMTLLARMGNAKILGVPACALFHERTSFDLLFPRLLASAPITQQDLASMGEGGMCLDCKRCTFPQCGFGKG